MNFVIPCLLGLERPIADELLSFGAEDVRCENGRVLFSGEEDILAAANIRSRYAERVLILVGEFEAHTFDELFEGVKALAWERYIGKKDAFPVKGYSLNSGLFSVRDCQAIIKKAVVDRLSSRYHLNWFGETGAVHQIQFALMNDRASLMLDTSGQGLHKRGYRPAANAAPIKETLAAALCEFSRLKHYHTLYDPMCGSGTIVIEGALHALNRAPGLNRKFAAESWEQTDGRIWAQVRGIARSLERTDIDFQGVGTDIDPEALEIAKINAERAGVAELVRFYKADARRFDNSAPNGTVITNPPYGERLLDVQTVEKLYRDLGKVFTRKHGWSYSVITADEDFEKAFGRRADKRRKLYNGMIKTQVYMYFK